MQGHEDVIRRRRVQSPHDPELPVAHSGWLGRQSPRRTAAHRTRHASGFYLAMRSYTWQRLVKGFLALIAIKVVVSPLLVLLFGNGYDPRGGLVGAVSDAALERLFADARQDNPTTNSTLYPLVTERTRRQKVPGYSQFLEELLAWHRQNVGGHQAPMPENATITGVKVTSISLTNSTGGKVDSLQSTLQRDGCRPGWFCRRCLKSRRWGSLQACAYVCATCYYNILCRDGHAHANTACSRHVEFLLRIEHVARSHPIPRIVHQEFEELIQPWRHPDLDRFQNSWRATGWEYRFYTPVMARNYVQRHYPSLVLQVYDRLRGRGQQSDFFRLLLLLKDGGVYTNIDVLLETDLDTLLTGNIGFVAARDDAPDGSRKHCLWNGVIATRPGHPFVLRAVTIIMNAVLNEWNEDDIDFEICSSRAEPLWRVRSATWQDNFLGCCALGMAVHATLGESALDEFHPGYLLFPINNTAESGLILMMSLDDTGAFRCSDIARNLLVASTKHMGLSKLALKGRHGSSVHRRRILRQ